MRPAIPKCLSILTTAVALAACSLESRDPREPLFDLHRPPEQLPKISKWRIGGGDRPAALLEGSVHTTVKVFGRADLELTCYRKKPRVRVGFDVRLGRGGRIPLSYRFDEKPFQTATVRIRSSRRNHLVLEEPVAVGTFLEGLRSAKVLKLDIRAFGEWHTALFLLYGVEEAIDTALGPCKSAASTRTPAGPRPQESDDDDDDDDD
jgi:hypothetical protein